jgi:hypothetical protein
VTTFRYRHGRPGLLAPWFLASLATVMVTLLTVSIAQRASVHLLANLQDPELAESVAAQLRTMKVFSVAVAPVHLLARWMLTASLFWALGTFLLPDLPFRTALTVAAFAGLPAVLGKGLDLAVAWYVGPEFSADLLPVMTSASSLAALWPGSLDGTWSGALMRQLTVFFVWSGALWTIGLREAGRTSWVRAVCVAAPVWLTLLAASTAGEIVRDSLAGMAQAGGA